MSKTIEELSFYGALEDDREYVIFVDQNRPERNRVLLELSATDSALKTADEWYEFLQSENIDFKPDDLHGTGSGFYVSVYDASADPAHPDGHEDDWNYDLVVYQGAKRMFWCNDSIDESRWTSEGELIPGIYALGGGTYVRLLNGGDLAEFFDRMDEWGDGNYFKAVCEAKALKIEEKESGCVWSISRHPLTFFDLPCPVCHKLAIACQMLDTICCHHLDGQCPHFIAHWETIEDILDERGVTYRLEGSRLFLLLNDDWKEALLVDPPNDRVASIWSGDNRFYSLPE